MRTLGTDKMSHAKIILKTVADILDFSCRAVRDCVKEIEFAESQQKKETKQPTPENGARQETKITAIQRGIPVVLTEKEAARYIGMSRSFLAQSRINGALRNRTVAPAYLKKGRTIRYRIEDLDKWLLTDRVEHVPPPDMW
jgi:hypothetical protein